MTRFSIAKKGYSVDEVEAFVAKLLQLTEDKLAEQKERIDELKAEIRDLSAEKAELKAREGSVSQALSEALRRSSEIERSAEARYALELSRLNAFRRRFDSLRLDIEDDLNLSEITSRCISRIESIEAELKRIMIEDFGLKSQVPQKIQESKEEKGFDLEEALSPKETLEEICKELGLI